MSHERILILEDSEERIKFFKSHLDGELHFARTASEALDELRDFRFSTIFLDNDLGKGNGTGIDVAVWIRRNIEFERLHIIVHSMNAPAAHQICKILYTAQSIPFTSLMSTLR